MEILEQPMYFWGSIIAAIVVLALWLYYRARRNERKNELFDDDSYYYEDELEESQDLPVLDLPKEEEPAPIKNEPEKPEKSKQPEAELIIALFVLPNDDNEGFVGSDIFTVLQDQGLSYGKMEIFHHYGMGEPKVKQAIFSVANILKPGTFDPKQMDEFLSPGLVFFMRLPGAFGGRVAFELMLSTAKKVAEHLEGTLTDEQQYILDQDMIDAWREQINQFEREKN